MLLFTEDKTMKNTCCPNAKERKKSLRKEVFRLIDSLDEAFLARADTLITGRLLSLDEYKAAQTVFCFVGTKREINTMPFLLQVLADKKKLAVPLCTGPGEMEARQLCSLDELVRGRYGIWEPPENSPLIVPEDIDLAVIPCVSCSRSGVRLGHGGGYYDRYFGLNTQIPTVMICRKKVMREDIPHEKHDLLFPFIISD